MRSPAVAKNSGARIVATTDRSGASAGGSSAPHEPITMPATNAPSTASKPSACVPAAASRTITTVTAAPRQRGGRHQESPGDPQAERPEQAGRADPGGRRALPADQADVDLDAGDADQQDDRDLAHRVEQVELVGPLRQQPRRELGRE